MEGSTPAGPTGYPAPVREQKNTTIAGFCSSFLPGLGQVYNGETVKGFVFFFLALAGFGIFLLPGLLVWLYAMYDAYAVAGKMNTGELEFRETRMLHMILFIVFAVIVIVALLIIILTIVMASLMSQLGPLGIGDNPMFNTNGLF
jgi:TM2 domain-containing membrane protein YozV